MKVWGSSEVFQKRIEFISYSPEYREQTLDVMRKSFFQFESVSVGSEINLNVEAQRDLEALCDDALKRSGVSLIAREVESDLIVGVSINVIQVNQPSSDEPTYFEKFRDNCKTENAKSLMKYMIEADSRVNIFETFKIDALFEIMFLAVLKEYGRQGIGLTLCKYSVELASDLKSGKDVEKYLSPGEPQPQLVTSLLTGVNTQVIGEKLGFEVFFQEPFANFSFNGKTFSERVGDPNLVYQLVAKRI